MRSQRVFHKYCVDEMKYRVESTVAQSQIVNVLLSMLWDVRWKCSTYEIRLFALDRRIYIQLRIFLSAQ